MRAVRVNGLGHLLLPPAPPALRNEHLARNDWSWLGQFSRAAKWVAELTVLHSADDGQLVSPACRHSEGRQGYLWAILTRPERRLQLLHEGWRGAMTPFLLAIALDCIYQLITVRFVYPLELLFTATLLALAPYAVLRGPFNRLARLFLPAARSPPTGRPAQNNKFIR